MSAPDRLRSDAEVPLAVRGLGKRFGERRALEAVSFRLEEGSVTGLVGENGAGKTTLLRSIAGTLPVTPGSVHVFGLDVTRRPEATKRLVGYLPEVPALYPEMRVDAYLRFRAELRGSSRTEGRRAALGAAERAAIVPLLGRTIGELSKGQRQRVAIASTLLLDPPLLLLDEPTAGLDPRQLEEFRALVRDLAPRCTILLSTHVLSEVEALCSHVLALHGGRVVFDGSLEDFRERAPSAAFQLVLEAPFPNLDALLAAAGFRRLATTDLISLLGPEGGKEASVGPAELLRRMVESGARVSEFSRVRPPLERSVGAALDAAAGEPG